MARYRLALAGCLLLLQPSCSGPDATLEERRLELMASRPSITSFGVPTSMRLVRFEYSSGSFRGPIYTVAFRDDDTFEYEGIYNAPRLGRVTGHFSFAALASWLEVQPLLRLTHLAYGGSPGGASYTVEIHRYNGPTSYFHSGWPVEDVELWGLFNVLQGITLTHPEISPGA